MLKLIWENNGLKFAKLKYLWTKHRYSESIILVGEKRGLKLCLHHKAVYHCTPRKPYAHLILVRIKNSFYQIFWDAIT